MPESLVTDSTADSSAPLAAQFAARWNRVYHFNLSLCGSPTVAEDVTAAAYADAARALATGRVVALTDGWLLTVSRRRMIDQWRRSERYRNCLAHVQSLAGVARQPSESPVDSEQVEAVLAMLPERHARVLRLRYLDDRPVEEVADLLGVSRKAIDCLLVRARRKFSHAWIASEVSSAAEPPDLSR